MANIKLRAHHLFCTALFEGRGYSAQFTENMYATIAKFADTAITIVQGHDDLCAKCPHLADDGSCTNGADNVRSRDKNAQEVCGVKVGESYTHSDLTERLSDLSEEDFNRVCQNCQWGRAGICSYEKLK